MSSLSPPIAGAEADDPDAFTDFPAASDHLGALLPAGCEATTVHLPDFPDLAAARQELFTTLQAGAVVVDYVGHGGVDRLASEVF